MSLLHAAEVQRLFVLKAFDNTTATCHIPIHTYDIRHVTQKMFGSKLRKYPIVSYIMQP
jgi:hypothetical protein